MEIKIIEKKKNGRTLCRINGRAYNLPNGLIKTLESESNLVEARVSPKSTDIEKQEQIVTILYEFIDNMIIDNAYKDYQKGYSTHGIREAVGTALTKILKLDNLEVMEVQ